MDLAIHGHANLFVIAGPNSVNLAGRERSAYFVCHAMLVQEEVVLGSFSHQSQFGSLSEVPRGVGAEGQRDCLARLG